VRAARSCAIFPAYSPEDAMVEKLTGAARHAALAAAIDKLES
jgi:hypothetical protein